MISGQIALHMLLQGVGFEIDPVQQPEAFFDILHGRASVDVMLLREQTCPALKRWAILVLSLRDALRPDSPGGATEHSPVF